MHSNWVQLCFCVSDAVITQTPNQPSTHTCSLIATSLYPISCRPVSSQQPDLHFQLRFNFIQLKATLAFYFVTNKTTWHNLLSRTVWSRIWSRVQRMFRSNLSPRSFWVEKTSRIMALIAKDRWERTYAMLCPCQPYILWVRHSVRPQTCFTGPFFEVITVFCMCWHTGMWGNVTLRSCFNLQLDKSDVTKAFHPVRAGREAWLSSPNPLQHLWPQCLKSHGS